MTLAKITLIAVLLACPVYAQTTDERGPLDRQDHRYNDGTRATRPGDETDVRPNLSARDIAIARGFAAAGDSSPYGVFERSKDAINAIYDTLPNTRKNRQARRAELDKARVRRDERIDSTSDRLGRDYDRRRADGNLTRAEQNDLGLACSGNC